MRNKRVLTLILFSFIFILLIGVASAGLLDWFKSLFSGNITGKATSETLTCMNGAIANWKFDESSWSGVLGEVKDSKGNENGAAFNGANTIAGKLNRGGNFDGVNDYVGVNPSSSTLRVKGDLAISLWAKYDSLGNIAYDNVLVSLGGSGQDSIENENYLYYLSINPDKTLQSFWESGAGNDEVIKSNAAANINFGEWHYYTLVRDSVNKKVRFFVDGEQLGTTVTYNKNPTTGGDSPISSVLYIGADVSEPTKYNFDGIIDDVSIFNRQLSVAEVAQLYNNGNGKEVCSGVLPPPPATCTDSDGGIKYYVKGETSDGTTTKTDSCDVLIGKVAEYYCNADNVIVSKSYICPYGCSNGACLQETVACTETDGVIDSKELAEGQSANIAGLNVKLVDADMTNLALIAKLFINGQEITLTSDSPVYIGDDRVGYRLQLISASDVDATIRVSNGKNYYKKGTTCVGESCGTDSCGVQPDGIEYVSEYFCDGQFDYDNEAYNCPKGCYDGACIADDNIDGCSLISVAIKEKVADLQAQGELIVLTEGEDLYDEFHVVVPGALLRVDIEPQAGLDDKIKFFNVISGEVYKAKINYEGKGTVTINGVIYGVEADYLDNYLGMTLDYPQTQDPDKMTFDCLINSCVDSDNGLDYYTKGYTIGNNLGEVIGHEGDGAVRVLSPTKAFLDLNIFIDEWTQVELDHIYNFDVVSAEVLEINYYGEGSRNNNIKYRYKKAVDFCDDSTELVEVFCEIPGTVQARDFSCPQGCSNGACIGDQSLVLLMHLNEKDGSKTYIDSSGKNNNGICFAGKCPKMITRAGGNAARFDGVDDYINVKHNESLDIKEAITISAWVKPRITGKAYSNIVSKNGRYGLYLQKDNGLKPGFTFKIAGGISWRNLVSPDAIDGKTYHHIVGVYDKNGGADNMKLYVDGVLKAQATYTDGIASTTGPLTLGRYGARYLNGTVDEVAIYNRALSYEEVLNLYKEGGGVVGECFDSDGGIKYYVKGETSDGVVVQTDFCDISNILVVVDFYCNADNKIDFEYYTCPNGCFDGACVSA